MNFKTTIILKNGCLQKKNNQYSKNNCIQTLLFIKYFFNPSHFSKTFTMVLSFKKKKKNFSMLLIHHDNYFILFL